MTAPFGVPGYPGFRFALDHCTIRAMPAAPDGTKLQGHTDVISHTQPLGLLQEPDARLGGEVAPSSGERRARHGECVGPFGRGIWRLSRPPGSGAGGRRLMRLELRGVLP